MTTINTMPGKLSKKLRKRWYSFWMRRASSSKIGRFAMHLASLTAPPDMECIPLAYINKNGCGYISPCATLYVSDLSVGKNIFLGDRVIIMQESKSNSSITLGNNNSIYRDVILDTGRGGSILMGDKSSIHHNSILKAYVSPIQIGSGVMIAPNCALYSYNHGLSLDTTMREQPLISSGGIVIGDEAWIGTGVVILDGAHIGNGAVIGAGSVVTGHIPDNAIAAGNPAKVIKYRE